MIETHSRNRRRSKQQLSLPFNETDLPSLTWAQAQRAAAVELLRQMLLEAVLAEVNTQETCDERREDTTDASGPGSVRVRASVDDDSGKEQS